MTNSSGDASRLHALISRLCDGEISTQEVSELDALLQGNEEAIGEYIDMTTLHLHLGCRMRAATRRMQITSDVSECDEGDAIPAQDAPGRRRSDLWTTRSGALFAIAASVLFVALFLMRSGTPAPEFAARIVESIDCDWGEQRWGTPQSAVLDVGGEIRLLHGLMVLEFGNGAEVTLEGPVHFTILAKDRGQLSFGKLVASVPDQGHGFVIQLPSVEIIDLGTKFGASVTEDGVCETHVFEGNVIVRCDLGKSHPQEWDLAAGSALRIATFANEIKEFASNPESFRYLSDFVDPVTADGEPFLNVPSNSGLALWLDAARRLQFDDSGRVVCWGDLSTGEYGMEDNAWQVSASQRPRWIRDAIGNRPAVHFDGSTHLETTPFSSGDDVTIICVFRSRPSRFLNHQSGQIVNLNGPPSLILQQTPENYLVGRLLRHNRNQDLTKDGWIETGLPAEEAPVVVAYVYGHSLNNASLYINGTRIGDSLASSAATVRSPKFIGASNSLNDFFVGDLSELLIFNSMLSSEQCTQISADLMRKYGIFKTDIEPQILSRPSQKDP